jgi:hypothetical protein
MRATHTTETKCKKENMAKKEEKIALLACDLGIGIDHAHHHALDSRTD